MKREGLALASAVQFLTRLPVPDPGWEDGRLDRAAKWFPLVGTLVGVLAGAKVAVLLAIGVAPPIAVLAGLLAAVLATGALHEDGLADTADGLGGGRDREHRLTIMKDSRIGAYAAIALIFAFGFRYLGYGAGALTPWHALALFAAAHCVGRAGMVGIVWSLDYARAAAEAKVPPLTGATTMGGVGVAGASVVLSLVPAILIFGAAPVAIGLALAGIATLALRALYRRKLGGWTGDTAGATQVIAEIAFVIGAAAWT